MDRIWLKSYPPGVAPTIDAHAWPSIAHVFADGSGRFAQRPRRQHQAIAQFAIRIDDGDFHRARQPVVLQAVIADDHVAAGGDQRLRRGDTIAVHAHLRAGSAGDRIFLGHFPQACD